VKRGRGEKGFGEEEGERGAHLEKRAHQVEEGTQGERAH